MRKGDKRTITVNGEKLAAEYLGKGAFSTCWKVGDSVYSFTDIDDYSKEIINLWCNASPHLPKVELVQQANDKNIYKMPLYRKLQAGTAAWKQFKALKKAVDSVNYASFYKNPNGYTEYSFALEKATEKAEDIQEGLKSAMQDLLYNSRNYDAILFEISPRNLAVDDAGNLILLDVMFNHRALRAS